MSRFLQNILYIIIALAIYYGVSAYFKVDFEPKSNAIYLPETYTHYRPTNIDNIKVYSLDKSGEANKSKIGIVKSMISILPQDVGHEDLLCNKNIQSAVKMAAKYGAKEVRYYCMQPASHIITPLSSLALIGYVYR